MKELNIGKRQLDTAFEILRINGLVKDKGLLSPDELAQGVALPTKEWRC